MTAYEIVSETIDYYQGHPERFSWNGEDQCVYINPEGQSCAFGRCMKPEILDDMKVNKSLNENSLTSILQYLGGEEYVLQEKYQGLPIEFWVQLQILHDDFFSITHQYWTKDAMITKEGEDRVKKILLTVYP